MSPAPDAQQARKTLIERVNECMGFALLETGAQSVVLANSKASLMHSEGRWKLGCVSGIWVPIPFAGRALRYPHGAAGLWRPLQFSDGAVSEPAVSHLASCCSSLDPGLCRCAGSNFLTRSCVLSPLRLRQEKTDTVRCVKSCRPNDVTCVLDPVHTISHTVVSLPTFREFTRPEGE